MNQVSSEVPNPFPDDAQGLVNKAVDAIVDLIIANLKANGIGKFAEAARLCEIGGKLIRTQVKSVKDFAMLEVDDAAEDRADIMPMPNRMQLNNLAAYQFDGNNGNPDQRRARLALEPAAQVERERAAAEIATSEATELDRLTTLRDRLPEDRRAPIDTRINLLMTGLETRNNAQLQMVPADVSRGHLAGAEGPEGDHGEGVRADANGGARPDGFALACHQEDVRPEAVGD